MTHYTCWGSVRGGCDIAHRTVTAAVKCGLADHRNCQKQGGYSDRGIRAIDDPAKARSYYTDRGPGRHLNDHERDEMERAWISGE